MFASEHANMGNHFLNILNTVYTFIKSFAMYITGKLRQVSLFFMFLIWLQN